VIKRAELVAFALVALLVICVVAVLYAAKAFFLPSWQPSCRHHAVTAAGFSSVIIFPRRFRHIDRIDRRCRRRLHGQPDLLALMEWITRLRNWDPVARQAARIRPAAGAVAGAAAPAWRARHAVVRAVPAAKIRLGTADAEFLSPTFTEFLLFSRPLFCSSLAAELRRRLIMTFGDHAARLRTLRILNAIEAILATTCSR